MAFDVSDHDQDEDHARLLVSVAAEDGSGSLVQIDAGSNAFAWRLAGIGFGAVLVALIYLLAATMFSRRRIAVLAGIFVAVDGMSYVMSRIGMNDIYVAVFIAAAYLVFWQIWSGRWPRSAWWALPLVGVLIGLAAATKWVGIYAMLGIWILVFARSALGRFLLVALIAAIAVVMGFGAPWPFLVVALATLALALVVVWVRPIQLELRDLLGLSATMAVLAAVGLAFTLAFNQVEGAREPQCGGARLQRAGSRGASGLAATCCWPEPRCCIIRAVRSLSDPDSDRRWQLPGELGGFQWPWIGACVAVIPLLVYFLAYIPYLQLGHRSPDRRPVRATAGHSTRSTPRCSATTSACRRATRRRRRGGAGRWTSSRSGSTATTSTSAASGSSTTAATRSCSGRGAGHHLVRADGLEAALAGLVLLVVAFAFQFLPWTRIERATFHYHYLTAVLFAMVAVAYVVDEMLRSWSYRPLAIAFLVLAGIVGVLVFPLGSALAMPDWYINMARSFPPWNYAFQFPNPPQGERGQLITGDSVKLVAGVLVAVSAAAFALYGRELLGRGPTQGDDQQDDAHDHQRYRPQQVAVDGGEILIDQEPDPRPDKD